MSPADLGEIACWLDFPEKLWRNFHVALASTTLSAPGLGWMMPLLWRVRGNGPITAPVFSRGVSVWFLLPSGGVLVSEVCSVDWSSMSSKGLSGAAAALEDGFWVAESSWRLSPSLRGAEVELRVIGEVSSSGPVRECWVLVSPKTLPHKLESRTSNFSPCMAVDLHKTSCEIGRQRPSSFPVSCFCTELAETGFRQSGACRGNRFLCLQCAQEAHFPVSGVVLRSVTLLGWINGCGGGPLRS